MTHPDPAFGVAGSEPPLSYPLPNTVTANEKPQASPDIVEWARERAARLRVENAPTAASKYESIAMTIEYLRDANTRLIADNNRLSAELRAARGEEGR